MPTLSYIDKYGSLFSRIDDFFEFNVNKFRFNFKFNNLFANSFNYIRFFLSNGLDDFLFLSTKSSFMKQVHKLSHDVLWFEQNKPIYVKPRFDVVVHWDFLHIASTYLFFY